MQEGGALPPRQWAARRAVGSVALGAPARGSSGEARWECLSSPSRLKLLWIRVLKNDDLLEFSGPLRPGLSLGRIVVPRGVRRNAAQARARASFSPAARPRRQRGGAALRRRARGRSPCARGRRARD